MLIHIVIENPPGTDRDSIAEFVVDAISSWGGQFHIEDPLFHSLRNRIKSVKVGGKLFPELVDYKKDK